MYACKNKDKNFPVIDLGDGYHCGQIVAHFVFFKIRPLTQVSVHLQSHKFGNSEMVFFISYWSIFVKSLEWSLAQSNIFFTVTSPLFIT